MAALLPRIAALASASAFVLVAASAQVLPPRGTDATFDVATWNIRQFGDPAPSTPPDPAQMRNAHAVLSQSGIDLWAVQEVTSVEVWDDLLARLQDDGYAGWLGPEPTFGNMKIGFLYDPSVVSVVGVGSPLPPTGSFGGHQPVELHARVTVGGASRTVRVVAFHAKAGSTEADHVNRTQGAAKLKTYIDGRIAQGESVILLGDFNDYLTRSRWRGDPRSPYAPFLEDDAYAAATLALEAAGIPTTCGAGPPCTVGLTIDHILYTTNLAATLAEVGRYEEALTGIPDFFSEASDHAPVLARLDIGGVVAYDGAERPAVRLLPVAPQPVRGAARLRFALGAPLVVRLDVLDALGRVVHAVEGAFGVGEHAVPLDGARMAPGVYVVRLSAGGAVQSAALVRAE